MPIDPKQLREHYASLSDDALRAVDRADLVESAQKCFDDELARRGALHSEPGGDGDQPDWLPDASEVFSRIDQQGGVPADDLLDARDALETEGIPCHLELSELPKEQPDASPRATHVWRVMVPGHLNLRATSVLDRDIFNANFEAEWTTHLETLSDDEVLEMNPEVVFCGLFDRIERVTRVYDAEIARRKLDNAI